MIKYSKLSKEQKLILLCSKINLSPEDKAEVTALLENDGINIEKYLIYALRNKVLPLTAKHLMNLDIHNKIHFQYKRFLDLVYGAHKEKNSLSLKILAEIVTAFDKANIKVVPLKGVILAPLVYKDLGLRTMGDIDFLVSADDKFKVPEVMLKIGFTQGYYDFSEERILPGPEAEIAEWRDTDANLYPFVKRVNDTTLKAVKIDFSFDVDKKRDYVATKKLLANAEKRDFNGTSTYMLDEIDFLIHIAFHLYKEATNIEWLEYNTDLNIIKFCDLREYLLYILPRLDWDRLVQRTRELDAEKAVYYGIYYTKYIFGDQFCDDFLKRLDIDTDFLNQYGTLDYKSPKEWKKTFEERLFSISNMDEISV